MMVVTTPLCDSGGPSHRDGLSEPGWLSHFSHTEHARFHDTSELGLQQPSVPCQGLPPSDQPQSQHALWGHQQPLLAAPRYNFQTLMLSNTPTVIFTLQRAVLNCIVTTIMLSAARNRLLSFD